MGFVFDKITLTQTTLRQGVAGMQKQCVELCIILMGDDDEASRLFQAQLGPYQQRAVFWDDFSDKEPNHNFLNHPNNLVGVDLEAMATRIINHHCCTTNEQVKGSSIPDDIFFLGCCKLLGVSQFLDFFTNPNTITLYII